MPSFTVSQDYVRTSTAIASYAEVAPTLTRVCVASTGEPETTEFVLAGRDGVNLSLSLRAGMSFATSILRSTRSESSTISFNQSEFRTYRYGSAMTKLRSSHEAWTTSDGSTYTVGGTACDVEDDWGFEEWSVVCKHLSDIAGPERFRKGMLRSAIRDQLFPTVIVKPHRAPIGHTTDRREMRARATLRRVVGDEQYEQLLRKGFITIVGPSGRRYNLRPGGAHAEVWENGRQTASLCITLTGDFPPTDALIMRAMMVWNDEDGLWAIANKHALRANRVESDPIAMPRRPLIEVARSLRVPARAAG